MMDVEKSAYKTSPRQYQTAGRPNQAGFRPKCSSYAHQIFMIMVLEHSFKYQQSTVSCLIDFTGAFDLTGCNFGE